MPGKSGALVENTGAKFQSLGEGVAIVREDVDDAISVLRRCGGGDPKKDENQDSAGGAEGHQVDDNETAGAYFQAEYRWGRSSAVADSILKPSIVQSEASVNEAEAQVKLPRNMFRRPHLAKRPANFNEAGGH